MAQVVVKTQPKERGRIVEFVHRCGEMIQVEYTTHVTHYRSAGGSIITQCPHCLQDIEYEDLQDPQMVKELGSWPDLIGEA